MAVSDTISDFLTRIRNGLKAEHLFVEMAYSKILQNIAEVLQKEGFLQKVLVNKNEHGMGVMRVYLKYAGTRRPAIQGLKRVSKPSCRKYVGVDRIPFVRRGMGSPILSTPQGVLSGREAKRQNVGGELLFLVW